MTDKKDEWKPSSLTQARRSAVIDMTGPSGTCYRLQATSLDDLVADEALPLELLHAALLEMTPGGVVDEIAAKLRNGDPETLNEAKQLSQNLAQLVDRLVLRAVTDPPLKPADVAKLDPFDKRDIAEIAQRKKVVDAAGKQVGADALAQFRAPGQEQ